MRISRSTPPRRLTSPTPGIASRARLASLSTNQDICSGVMVSDRTTQVISGSPVMSIRWTIGSCMSCGRVPMRPLIALRTSLVAFSTSVDSSNSMIVTETPSVTVERMCRTPLRPAILSSIRRVTWVSISVGAAPGRLALT